MATYDATLSRVEQSYITFGDLRLPLVILDFTVSGDIAINDFINISHDELTNAFTLCADNSFITMLGFEANSASRYEAFATSVGPLLDPGVYAGTANHLEVTKYTSSSSNEFEISIRTGTVSGGTVLCRSSASQGPSNDTIVYKLMCLVRINGYFCNVPQSITLFRATTSGSNINPLGAGNADGVPIITFVSTLPNNSPNILVNRILVLLDSMPEVTPSPIHPDAPYETGGTTGDDETEPTGGEGDFDNESDEIPIPLPPTTGAVDSGFITLYNPSMSEIQALGSFMWSDLFDLDTFKKIFGDPMQAILGLSIVPVVPPTGSTVEVKIGNVLSGVRMKTVSTQFMQKDFGQITLNEYWGGYLDYSPYTQVEIYLPFIGVRPLSTDDVMGKTLHLVYNIDLLSGACMAFIAVNEDVLYQFIGQCSCSVPITGNDWTNVINGVLNIAGAIGTTVATGGLSAPQAVGAVTALASSVVSSKPRVEKSGSLSGMGGMLGVFSPYLIITRPRQALPASQNAFQGYPSFITRTLGSISGFTRVSEVHLDNITCTDAEKQEIKTLLEQGVIL